MFDFMKNELFFTLGNLLDNSVITDNINVVCFGFNHYCKHTISFLLGVGIRKDRIFIVDNYTEGSFKDIQVHKPEEVLCPHQDDMIVLVATRRNKQILNQLGKLGYKKKKQAYETLNVASKFYKRGSWVRIHYPNLYNDIWNGWGYSLYKQTHREVCSLTEPNKKFKNIHKGKRCFIMGNGPSLKKVDFSLLEKEYVFGVNQIMGVDGWERARINYWVCMDGDFWGLGHNANYDFYKEIEKFEGMGITAFVPVEARYYCQRHTLERCIDLCYVNWKTQYINLDQPVSLSDVNMEKVLMQPYNVVIACINIAVYMGFEEIFLLGCDQSVLKNEIDTFLGFQSDDMHAGDERNDVSANITYERMKAKGMYFEIKTQLVQLMQYRIMNNYCKARKIRLVNLSSPTLIEAIPCKKISEIL